MAFAPRRPPPTRCSGHTPPACDRAFPLSYRFRFMPELALTLLQQPLRCGGFLGAFKRLHRRGEQIANECDELLLPRVADDDRDPLDMLGSLLNELQLIEM